MTSPHSWVRPGRGAPAGDNEQSRPWCGRGTSDRRSCPRCRMEPLACGERSVSRTTIDPDRPVFICTSCCRREALAGVVQRAEWPLSIDALLAEDPVRYALGRAAVMRAGLFEAGAHRAPVIQTKLECTGPRA